MSASVITALERALRAERIGNLYWMLNEAMVVVSSLLSVPLYPTKEQERVIRVACLDFLHSQLYVHDGRSAVEIVDNGEKLILDEISPETDGMVEKKHNIHDQCRRIMKAMDEILDTFEPSRPSLATFYNIRGAAEMALYKRSDGDIRGRYYTEALSSLSTAHGHALTLRQDHPIPLSISRNMAVLHYHHSGEGPIGLCMAEDAIVRAKTGPLTSITLPMQMDSLEKAEGARVLKSLKGLVKLWKSQ